MRKEDFSDIISYVDNFYGVCLMELPYCVFDVSSQTGKFVLSITSVDIGAPETLERCGLTADFNAKIEVKGITADIKCWLTIGNLYSFYSELQNCYSTLIGCICQHRNTALVGIPAWYRQ